MNKAGLSILRGLLLTLPTLCLLQAQTPVKAPNPEQQTMALLLEYSRPAAAHAQLSRLVGTWLFEDKHLPFVKGKLVRQAIYEGRFYVVDITGGQLLIPTADGQMKRATYQGMEIEGYDNVKKAFSISSINNHIGSGIASQVGRYDAASKEFRYEWQSELAPGQAIRHRKVVRLIDADHYTEEYYEQEGGVEKRVRELLYSRSSGK